MATSAQNILVFTQQFASMIRSNLQLVDVLDNLASETPQAWLKGVIRTISEDVRRGVDLSDAMASHPKMFDEVYVSVIRSGIESGRLSEALTQMAEYQAIIHALSQKIRAALRYPILVVAAFVVVFHIQVFMILPNFQVMYADFDQDLPWPTQLLLDMGAEWRESWYLYIGVLALVVFAFLFWIRTADGRAIWDRLKLSLPVVGVVWRMSALARFLRTLAVQVQNDVALLSALRLAADASANVYLREVLYVIAANVERGRGIADSFREYHVFDGIVLQMISSGEKASTLDELLMSSAIYFDNLTQDQLDAITGLINPVLTIVVGLGIAGMMVASFLPVFQMGSIV